MCRAAAYLLEIHAPDGENGLHDVGEQHDGRPTLGQQMTGRAVVGREPRPFFCPAERSDKHAESREARRCIGAHGYERIPSARGQRPHTRPHSPPSPRRGRTECRECETHHPQHSNRKQRHTFASQERKALEGGFQVVGAADRSSSLSWMTCSNMQPTSIAAVARARVVETVSVSRSALAPQTRALTIALAHPCCAKVSGSCNLACYQRLFTGDLSEHMNSDLPAISCRYPTLWENM